MNYFEASFDTIIIRFYMLMTIVIGSLFIGAPIFAYLAVPIFLSAMLGVTFWSKKTTKSKKVDMKIVTPQSITGNKAA